MRVLRCAIATMLMLAGFGTASQHADRVNVNPLQSMSDGGDPTGAYEEIRQLIHDQAASPELRPALATLHARLHDRAADFAEPFGLDLPTRDASICAFATGSLRGSAGTARLGGGGELQSFDPTHVDVADFPAVAFRSARTIVIIDDFGGRPLRHLGHDDDAVHRGLQNLGREVPKATTQTALSRYLANTGADLSHGDIVLFHALGMLMSGDNRVAGVQTLRGDETHHDGVRLTIADRDGHDVLDLILANISFEEIGSVGYAFGGLLRWIEPGAEVVLNMSWNLGDCYIVQLYREVREAERNASESLLHYRSFLRELAFVDPHVMAAIDAICGAIFPQDSGIDCADDVRLEFVLHAALDVRVEQAARQLDVYLLVTDRADNVLRVAAAGNESLPFPLPPASFRCVIGVAASLPNGARALWSNRGDFIVDEDRTELGAFFPTGLQGDGADEYLFYGGTSFAAPFVALGSEPAELRVCGP